MKRGTHDFFGIKKKRRLFAVVCALLLLIGSVSAQADTYNFFFKDKKKKTEDTYKDRDADKSEVDDLLNDQSRTSKTQVITPKAGQPIVIHNINNVGAPGQAINQGGSSSRSEAIPGVTPSPTPVQITTVQRVPSRRKSQWRVGLSGMIAVQEFLYKRGFYPGSSYENGQQYTKFGETAGAIISLSHNLSRKLGINLYAGFQHLDPTNSNKLLAGAEFEFMPFQIALREDWDVFELGLIAGGSTLLASENNIGTIHAGARVDINFLPNFGISAVGRGNLGYVMFEFGITARL